MRRVPNNVRVRESGQGFKRQRSPGFVGTWIVRSLMRSSSRDLRGVRRILGQNLFIWFEGSMVEPARLVLILDVRGRERGEKGRTA